MSRILRIVIGLALIGYGIYSGNAWFYLGIIPLVAGIMNYCPMEKLMGGCKDGECSTGSCAPKKEKSTCCSSSSNKVVIKILGTGCPNCIALKKIVDEAIKSIDKECEVQKIEDLEEIMKYQVMSTPGLVINDKVKSAGKLLSVIEVTNLINGAGEQSGTEIKTKCCGN